MIIQNIALPFSFTNAFFYHKGSYNYILIDYFDILQQHCPFINEDI